MENFSIYFSNCFFTPVISFLLLISITPALSATINQLNNNEKDFPYKISEVEQRQTSSSLSVLTSEPSYKPTSKEELIYEIAIKYKQISRLSLLSCHKASSSENFEGMQTSSSSIQPTFSEQNEMPIAIKIDSITTNASKNYVDTASMLRYFFVRQNHHLLQEQENVHYFQRQQQHHEWNNAKSVLIKVIAIETILNPFYYNSSSCGMCNMSQNNTCSMNSDVDRVCSLHDYSSANNLFSRISKNETFHQFIILDMSCGYKNARKILELASSKAMFNAYYHWLLIDDYPHNRSKVDNNDKDSINNFYYNDGLMDEISQYKQDISFIENFLSDLNININTELILAQRKIDQDLWDYYQLFDVWNPGRHYYGKLNITNVGTFSQHNGLQMYNWYKSQTSVVRRMDMKNARIRCMVVVVYNQKNESLVPYLENREKPHLDSINHLTFAMVSYVRDMFNFQFDLQGTTTWGYLKNGTYDGMIGALMRNETDIGGSPIFFRTERAKLVDYTARISVLRACFIFRHPKNSNRKRAIFLQPFESNVWVALGYIALAILITGWILKAVELHLPNETSHNGKNQRSILDGFKNKILQGIGLKERRNHLSSLNFNKFSLRNFLNKCQKMNFLDLITFFVGMICFQSAPPNINNLLSGRIVLMSVLFLAFFLLQYYSASITGTLLTPPVKNIKTLRDLIDSDLDLGFEDIIYARDYFKRTTDPEAIAIYEKTGETYERNNSYHAAPKDLKPPKVSHNKKNKVKHQIWLQPKDGMEFVKKGGFALHVTSNTAYKILSERFTEKEICELSEIQLFPPEKMVHIVQKGSPIRKAMMYGLRRVIEHGLVDYQNHIWYFPKPGCVDTIHLEDLVVDMQTFLSAFLILMYGFAASIVILAIELMLNFIAKKLP